jgi:hypothetical protein
MISTWVIPRKFITRIGDAEAPGIIAHAVYAGHRFARNLGCDAHATVTLRDRGAGPLLSSIH